MDEYEPGNVYKNLYRMFIYRNIKHSADELSKDKLSEKLNHYEYVTIAGNREPTDPRGAAAVIVFLIAPGSKYAAKRGDFKRLLKGLPEQGNLEIMFVSKGKLTVHIMKELSAYKQAKPLVYVEDYDYEKFIIEIPLHESVPIHRLASDDEIDAFCSTRFTSRDRFPKILSSDPMAVWLGVRPGMCVHVIRLSETAGEAEVFKFCIKG